MNIVRRHFVILMGLLVIFAAPGFFAYLFYTHPSWIGGTTTNRGMFIKPPVLVRQLGKPFKWRLIYWTPQRCDSVCKEDLDELARVRLALGRYLYDVDIFMIIGSKTEQISAALLNILREKDIHVLKLSEDELDDLPLLRRGPAIFIANPDNYLVLSYELTTEPDDVFHDIKQLVKKN